MVLLLIDYTSVRFFHHLGKEKPLNKADTSLSKESPYRGTKSNDEAEKEG
jgi:hypothetical protein